MLQPRRDGDGYLERHSLTASTTVIFAIVSVVIDVTVIVVITTVNNLSELAMKWSYVEALPGAVRYLHLKTRASRVSCERVDRTDDSTFRTTDDLSCGRANLVWN